MATGRPRLPNFIPTSSILSSQLVLTPQENAPLILIFSCGCFLWMRREIASYGVCRFPPHHNFKRKFKSYISIITSLRIFDTWWIIKYLKVCKCANTRFMVMSRQIRCGLPGYILLLKRNHSTWPEALLCLTFTVFGQQIILHEPNGITTLPP